MKRFLFNIISAGAFFLIALLTFSCRSSVVNDKKLSEELTTVDGTGDVKRALLTYDFLRTGGADTLVDFSAYAIPMSAAPPSNTFEGRLTLHNLATSGKFQEVKDRFNYTDSADSERMHLPPFDYEFVQTGSHIIPLKRGYLVNTHETWEYILEPGRVWDEKSDNGYSRAAIPFTLKQKNQNCLHNGVLMFIFKDNGGISFAAYQIASETCAYFQFNMWGTVSATYSPYAVESKAQHVLQYIKEVTSRMPTRPISELTNVYPDAKIGEFSAPGEVTPDHMTLYGFVIDSINYVGGCQTRYGVYPFCETLNVPSYSTAKSISAGIGLMRLEKLYPGSRKALIGHLLPACGDNGNWNDVTMENALDMSTGNYDVPKLIVDEGARHTNRFFAPLSHKGKIEYSCSHYSRKSEPGTTLVYHTSDTYILGTAMNAYLRSATENPEADYFDDLIVKEIFEPLATSPTSKVQQRTYDSVAQPFSGYGLFYHHDDVAKIAVFLNNGATINGLEMLDKDMYSSVLDDNKTSGLQVNASGARYDNGFWLRNFNHPEKICSDDVLIPCLEGYGGIKIYLLPNNTVYYYFSDNHEYGGKKGVIESNRIRPFCSSH